MVIKKEGHYFYTCDGESLKSMEEMLNWIKNSDNNSFSHHVTSDRNDFSKWTKQILKDSLLSKKLKPNQSVDEMVKIIKKRIDEKNKKKNKKNDVITKIKEAIFNG